MKVVGSGGKKEEGAERSNEEREQGQDEDYGVTRQMRTKRVIN